MRTSSAFAAAVTIVLLGSAAMPASAQTYDPKYPVCLQVYTGGFMDFYFECGYTSMPQCQMSASGRAAQCVVNPYYVGPKGKRSKRQTSG